MASHHYPHHPHHPYDVHTHLPTTCCCNCEFTSSCFQPHQPSPPAPPPPTAPLLHHSTHYPSIYAHKFQQSHFQFQPLDRQKQMRIHRDELPEIFHRSSAISSLISRIEALESSLHQISAPSYSLRDLAARTIQIQFRAFLVRRSRTLRQLKDLAFIRSSFNSLKSSICNETHVDLKAVSLETMDLLLDLDSVQCCDPMVRESKRSISRDLVRFLNQIDNVNVKRNPLPLKPMKNLRPSQNVNVDKSRVRNSENRSFENQKTTIEKLKGRIEKICELSRLYENGGEDLNLKKFHHFNADEEEESLGVFSKNSNQNRNRNRNRLLVNEHKIQPGVKKSVRFAANGNLSSILGNNNQFMSNEDQTLEENYSSDELVENSYNEAKEIKEFSEVAEEENEDEEEEDGKSPKTHDRERNVQGENGDFTFSAPLPVKMENRVDLMKIRNSLQNLE